METSLDNIIVIILTTFCLSFAIAYASVLHKLSKLTQEFSKLFISHKSLQDFIKKNNLEFKSDNDIHKENFIKFLSDSRDWAFMYIEDVQKSLEKFILNVEPEINRFDEDGSIYEGTAYYDFMSRISKEYKELKKLMPIENINKDA
jgi:hypothetical protein